MPSLAANGSPTRGASLYECGSRRRADLPEMLAARRFDQPVERVVGVVGARLDPLVAEEDGLLRVVANVR